MFSEIEWNDDGSIKRSYFNSNSEKNDVKLKMPSIKVEQKKVYQYDVKNVKFTDSDIQNIYKSNPDEFRKALTKSISNGNHGLISISDDLLKVVFKGKENDLADVMNKLADGKKKHEENVAEEIKVHKIMAKCLGVALTGIVAGGIWIAAKVAKN